MSELNENQQIVLNHLRMKYTQNDSAPILIFAIFAYHHFNESLSSHVAEAYMDMSKKEDIEILQAFVTWVLEQEEEKC